MMPFRLLAILPICSLSLDTTKWSAPRRLVASSRLFSLVDSTVTSSPMALPIFTALQSVPARQGQLQSQTRGVLETCAEPSRD